MSTPQACVPGGRESDRRVYRSGVRPLDFTLPDHAGGSFRLADALRERTVVVLFYRGDW
jgi:peroxiredoxin